MVVDDAMKGRLDGIKRSYQALTERLGDPDVVNDSNLLRKIMSERSTIEETVMAYDEYCTLAEELEGAKELFNSDDSDMKEMAREEMKEIEPQMEALQEKIKILMLPKDPNDDRNILLEIRAGTGGSEANIFAGKLHRRGSSVVWILNCTAVCVVWWLSIVGSTTLSFSIHPFSGDLLDLYKKYASTNGWVANVVESSAGDDGGFKNVVLDIRGEKVYSKMKWEAGVHRVQRVPATESQGRVHTSTATVAVMPECDEVDVNIDPKDIEMSTMRSGGAGGQVRVQ